MADDDLQNGGAIPPKLSPISVKAPTPPAAAPQPAAPAEPAAPAVAEAPAAPAATPPATPAAPAAPAPGSTTSAKRPVMQRKTVILRKPGEKPAPAPAAPAATAPVMLPDEPPATTSAPQGIAISHQEAAKKMTARISLASATGQIPEVIPSEDDVKTIKLRPPSQPAPAAVQAAKSKTSRISLETALGSEPEPAPTGGTPRTIRLKRPSEMGKSGPATPAVQVKADVSPSVTAELAPPPAAAPAAVEAVEESPTQKKTIKVKRPTAAGGPKITLSKGDAASEKSDAPSGDGDLQSLSSFDSIQAAPVADKVNPFFIVAAVLAILVTLNLAWIFAAQLYGPNAAVADFAVAQGPDMPDPIGALRIQ